MPSPSPRQPGFVGRSVPGGREGSSGGIRGGGLTGAETRVDIYWARVSADAPTVFLPLLGPAERDRMARFRFDRDRASYASAHGLLRRLLQRCPPGTDGADFIAGPFGKPGLPPPAAHFSLSHAQGMVAIAICPTAPVGVDVEPLSRPVDARSMAASVLSGEEVAELAATGWRSADFLARWVAKEALAKADGRGLQADFRQIRLTGDPPQIAALPPDFGPVRSWSISLKPVEDHILCAAVRAPAAVWTWQQC